MVAGSLRAEVSRPQSGHMASFIKWNTAKLYKEFLKMIWGFSHLNSSFNN